MLNASAHENHPTRVGDFTRARVSHALLSLRKNEGLLVVCIQLFRERSVSEKGHATMPKGIAGGFEFSVHQRNLKEWHERP